MLPILPLLLLLLFPGALPARGHEGMATGAAVRSEVRLLALAVQSARHEAAREEAAPAAPARVRSARVVPASDAKAIPGARKPSRDRDGPKV